MKKQVLFGTILLSLSVFFSSCFNPIFYEIKNDVAPEAGTITGIIRSIARYTVDGKEFLVTISAAATAKDENGKKITIEPGIKYKPVDAYDVEPENALYSKHGNWKPYTKLPEDFQFIKYDYFGEEDFVGQQMLKIISDDSYLYLISAEYTNDGENGISTPTKIHLYTTKINGLKDENTWNESEWKEISYSNPDNPLDTLFPVFVTDDYSISAFNIFSTNSVQTAHRHAYLRSGGSSIWKKLSDSKQKSAKEESIKLFGRDCSVPVYYELSGGELKPLTGTTSLDEETTTSYGYNSAVWYKDEVKFFNSQAAETNETYEKDPTMIYYGVRDSLYYYDGTESKMAVESKSQTMVISCIAVCADSVLFGKASYDSTATSATGGIAKTSLSEDGIPGTELMSFETNAEIKLKPAYFILTLLNENPAKNEIDSNLFASIAFLGTGASSNAIFENVGMWSYYPSRGNWNKE